MCDVAVQSMPLAPSLLPVTSSRKQRRRCEIANNGDDDINHMLSMLTKRARTMTLNNKSSEKPSQQPSKKTSEKPSEKTQYNTTNSTRSASAHADEHRMPKNMPRNTVDIGVQVQVSPLSLLLQIQKLADKVDELMVLRKEDNERLVDLQNTLDSMTYHPDTNTESLYHN